MENNFNTYDPEQVFKKQSSQPADDSREGGPEGDKEKGKGKMPGIFKNKGFRIFLIVLAVFIVLVLVINFFSSDVGPDGYVADLHVDGTISEGTSNDGYSQQWLMDTIDKLEKDRENKGILLCVNSPGGSVYATAEVYHKLEEYRKVTGRPIATYMGSMAASGGYYISMASEEIYANENCWTGSIGVIVGTIFDFSGLMDKLGIKGVDVVSGPNKAMGSALKPLTKEQLAIYQSIVDESYNRFVDVVAKGRNMSVEKVKPLADGRVYSATQAKEVGLIDKVVITQEEAEDDMRSKFKLGRVTFKDLSYEPKRTLLQDVLGVKGEDLKQKGEYEQLFELMEKNSQFTVAYLSQIRH